MTDQAVVVIQHLEPEGPALIGDAMVRRGLRVDTVRTDLGETVPTDASELAALVVMGGPMSAGSDQDFPSRQSEIALLRDALDRAVPVLGICLGAQLVAVAGGAAIHRGPTPEIGWGTVSIEPGAAEDPLLRGLTGELAVLHWHGDTFDLPEGAIHLASSAAYPNQGFRLGPRAWGLQFHLEVDQAAVDRFVASVGHEAADPAAISREAGERLARSAADRDLVLDRFAALVRTGGS